MNLLIFLMHPEPARSSYERYLAPRHPELSIKTFGSVDEAADHAAWADTMMCFGNDANAKIFKKASRLRWVHSLGTGTDGISDSPDLGKDVLVTATRGIHGAPMFELAILMMLAFSRDFRRIERQRDQKTFARWPGQTVQGKTVGILGLGTIAETMAPRFKALGMTVIGISRNKRPVAGFDEVHSRGSLRMVVPHLDFLVLLAPLESETHNIINADILAAMKPSAFLINLSRGGVLDETALAAALDANQIAGAALDVFAQEPPPSNNSLWSRPNVFITPHFGGYYDGYARDAAEQFERNLTHFAAGRYDAMSYRVSRG